MKKPTLPTKPGQPAGDDADSPVPNDYAVVEAVFASGDYNLKSHDDQAEFVDDVVEALHEHDANWGHLKKKPGQTQIHGHGEDSCLYLKDEPGQSCAVDFIAGAGGPDPKPTWNPDTPRYSPEDWMNPDDHEGGGGDEPPPAGFPYPDEPTTVRAYQDAIQRTYAEAGRQFPDPADSDAFRWFTRYGYSCSMMPEPEASSRHLAELRADLGLPPA